MAERAANGRLCILLAVCDGAGYLPAQLDSLAAQDFADWDLLAGDDASRDASPGILREFAGRMRGRGHRVDLVAGPRAGAAAHFLTLLAHSAETDPDWLAFADQDDVWLPDKLSRAVTALAAQDRGVPCLYCSRTWVTGPALDNPVLSRGLTRPPGFRNALVQNIAAGNTIVLNRAAAALARAAVPGALAVPGLPAHDWWVYQIVTGAGGRVLHDDRPSLYYRQHGANQVGANHGLAAALARARAILAGGYAGWNSANIAALRAAADHLTPDSRAALEAFAALRGRGIAGRLAGLARLGAYRQSRATQAALWLAAALGRL